MRSGAANSNLQATQGGLVLAGKSRPQPQGLGFPRPRSHWFPSRPQGPVLTGTVYGETRGENKNLFTSQTLASSSDCQPLPKGARQGACLSKGLWASWVRAATQSSHREAVHTEAPAPSPKADAKWSPSPPGEGVASDHLSGHGPWHQADWPPTQPYHTWSGSAATGEVSNVPGPKPPVL